MRSSALSLVFAGIFYSSSLAVSLVPTSEFGALDDRGINGFADDAVLFQGQVVVCGSFDRAGPTAVPSHVAAWSGHGWTALPPVPSVGPLFVHDGELYSNEYRLQNGAWAALPSPPGLEIENVEAACTMAYELVVGGLFRDTNTNLVSRAVHAFDGVDWRPLATDLTFDNTSGTINVLHVYLGDLILGARYLNGIDGVTVANVAHFDGTQWQAMGSLPHFVLALETFQGDLYASARHELYYGMYRWNAAAWEVVGNMTLPVRDLLAADDVLYAGGRFNVIDGQSTGSVAQFDGATWSAVGEGLCWSNVYALVRYGMHLYAAGDIRCVPPALVHVAQWDGSAWRPMNEGGLGLWSAPSGEGVRAFLEYQGAAVVAGEFDRWGLTSDEYRVDARSVSLLGDGEWSALSLPTSDGLVVSLVEHQGALFAAGVDRYPSLHAQIWRWENGTWSGILGNSFGQSNFVVGELRALESFGEDLILAGQIVSIGTIPWTNIARWDGIGFGGVGGGPDGWIYDLAVHGADLIAAGDFSTAGGTPAANIARWNGSSWMPMGDGFDGPVRVLAIHGGSLYAGGDFTLSGSTSTSRVARWDGMAWRRLNAGLNGSVTALASHDGELFVLGSFTTAGSQSASGLASWEGSAGPWTGYDLSTNGTSMAIHSTAEGLLLGGTFTEVTLGGRTETSHEVARLVPDATSAPPVPDRRVALRVLATPNPFNPSVRISFEMAFPAPVEVKAFDARGRLLRRWSLGHLGEGLHHLDWDGTDRRGEDVASGVTFLEVWAGKARGVTKVVLVR